MGNISGSVPDDKDLLGSKRSDQLGSPACCNLDQFGPVFRIGAIAAERKMGAQTGTVQLHSRAFLNVSGGYADQEPRILGQVLNQALGDKRGIVRTGHAIVPMDDALALIVVDFGGRSYAEIEVDFTGTDVGDLPVELVKHFLVSLASEARMNLHSRILRGEDDHHKAEAMFKALARALDDATRKDNRLSGSIPSTKDVIEG